MQLKFWHKWTLQARCFDRVFNVFSYKKNQLFTKISGKLRPLNPKINCSIVLYGIATLENFTNFSGTRPLRSHSLKSFKTWILKPFLKRTSVLPLALCFLLFFRRAILQSISNGMLLKLASYNSNNTDLSSNRYVSKMVGKSKLYIYQ